LNREAIPVVLHDMEKAGLERRVAQIYSLR